MLYVSKAAKPASRMTGRAWLAVGYAVAAVLLLVLAVAACRAQSDRVEGELAGAAGQARLPICCTAQPLPSGSLK